LKQEILSPTVYALSTAPAKSAIGVIRITGPASKNIFRKLTQSEKLPKHRVATVRKIYDVVIPKKAEKTSSNLLLLDECLILYFKSPKSYTGEDLLELHLHGGTAVINRVMSTIAKFHTPNAPIRLAEHGEFSKRAFQNQRFDLTEVEGINTLINAETETQRISALTSMKGQTNVMFNNWRERILKNIALLTTVIDFGEDHDIEEINDLFDTVEKDIKTLEIEINDYLLKVRRSQVLLDGIKLTLTGPPNAGKSSLLNILAQDDKAIVSSIAGTTRDAMEVPLDVNGFKVVVGDTAGIRESSDIIENEGIKRAKKRSLESDINVLILPANEIEINETFLSHALQLIDDNQKEVLVIINKSDLINESEKAGLLTSLSSKLNLSKDHFIFISCTKQSGISELVDTLTKMFQKISYVDKEDPISISNRAKEILVNDVLFGFSEFHNFKSMDDIVMASEGLRSSVDGIGKITGETIGVEEILGIVFSKFCIGK
jgi:tRNA modification GTPase